MLILLAFSACALAYEDNYYILFYYPLEKPIGPDFVAHMHIDVERALGYIREAKKIARETTDTELVVRSDIMNQLISRMSRLNDRAPQHEACARFQAAYNDRCVKVTYAVESNMCKVTYQCAVEPVLPAKFASI
jgi:hypothetical protein